MIPKFFQRLTTIIKLSQVKANLHTETDKNNNSLNQFSS